VLDRIVTPPPSRSSEACLFDRTFIAPLACVARDPSSERVCLAELSSRRLLVSPEVRVQRRGLLDRTVTPVVCVYDQRSGF
jgi:hypothetical protein